VTICGLIFQERRLKIKRFSSDAILHRLTQRAEVKEEWSRIIEQGAIGSTFAAYAEGGAELARYMEYLLQEKKWRTARNITSLTHQADLISRKRGRAVSAVGFVVVSHTDANGVPRLPNYGSTFFSLDARSDYDDLTQKQDASVAERTTLVPWTNSSTYFVPGESIFRTNKGVEFFSTGTVECRPMKEPYSAIESNSARLADFRRAGGWDGIKYIRIPVMQGRKVTVDFGLARGLRFESFAIESMGVEAANNSVSSKFFVVTVAPHGTGSAYVEVWREVANIRLAGPYDKVYETRLLTESGRVLVKFGDGVTGLRLPPGAKVSCQYIETLGAAGNVNDRFQITQMAFPPGFNVIDPRTNLPNDFLQCLNTTAIMGGRDVEDASDLKHNAPPSYLMSYSTATGAAYYKQIMATSPINLLRLKVFQSRLFGVESFGAERDDSAFRSVVTDGVLDEVNFAKKALLITAIKANGEKIDDPVKELLNPLVMAMREKTSPNDSFEYVEPNFIRIRPNVVVGTDEGVPDDDLVKDVKRAVLQKYSVFVQEFGLPYYYSVVNEAVKTLPYSKYVELFFEAKADVDPKPFLLSDQPGREALRDSLCLLAFHIKFDEVFAKNPARSGFRNFRYNGQYLVRVDVKFSHDPTQDATFFLFDNRTDTAATTALMSAEDLPVDPMVGVPTEERVVSSAGFDELTFYDETSDLFLNRQVRTAQFAFVEKVTTDAYASRLKSFLSDPKEIRPLFVDSNGANEKFDAEQVPEDERVSLGFSTYTSGLECYRANSKYWDHAKVYFKENYDDPKSPNYASGYFVAPLFKLLDEETREELYSMFPYELDLGVLADEIRKTLNQVVTIEAYARPVADDFEPIRPFDVLFSTEDDVVAEKAFLV
jgi:hypothetical protein